MKAVKDVIAAPLMSEKAISRRTGSNQYTFRVMPSANKAEIKNAVENRFQVKVLSVNTLNVQGKIKQVRGILGRRAAWKKAVIRLQTGDSIKEFE